MKGGKKQNEPAILIKIISIYVRGGHFSSRQNFAEYYFTPETTEDRRTSIFSNRRLYPCAVTSLWPPLTVLYVH
jgi:hypothetical protein